MTSENQNIQKRTAEEELTREKSIQKKRRWQRPEIIEENFRNTEEQPEMPFAPQQTS